MPGPLYHVKPIPHVPEDTRDIPAGPVTFGVEFRLLTEDGVDTFFNENDPDGKFRKMHEERFGQNGTEDEGLSIHVFEASSGEEILRFDCFDEDPHYHYIYNVTDDPSLDRVDFDWVVNGDMFKWLMPVLRTKLPTLLTHAGRPELAAACEQQRDTWVNALDDVEKYVGTLDLTAVARRKAAMAAAV